MRVSRHFHKLLAVVIALATAGAQVVCACSTPAVHQPLPPISSSCESQKECCRKAQTRPVQPAKQAPCDQCNLKHRAQQAMPDRHDNLPPLEVSAIALPVAAPALIDIVTVQSRLFDEFSPPPLLRDLFHVHALLLN